MALAYHDVLVEVKADDEPVVAKRVARHDEQGSARGTKHLREFLVLFLQHPAAKARDDVQELAASLAYLYWQT